MIVIKINLLKEIKIDTKKLMKITAENWHSEGSQKVNEVINPY